jgi:hypothetical protein
MGVDYNVALLSSNWPTVQAFQQCIDQKGWPIKLGRKDEPRWTKPLDAVPHTLGLPLEFKGEPLELEAGFVTLSPTQSFASSFDRPPDTSANGVQEFRLRPGEVLKPVDINATLNELGARDARFNDGDRVLTLTFRSDKKEWQAGAYIMAGLIKCFDGYGFELQGGQHGRSGYADSLLKDAEDLNSRK